MREAHVNATRPRRQAAAIPAAGLLSVLVLATVVVQFPPIIGLYYEAFRAALYAGFGAALFMAVSRPRVGDTGQPMRGFIAVVVYGVGLVLVMALLGGEVDSVLLTELLVPFGVLFCSIRTPIGGRSLRTLMGLYVFLSCVLSVWTVRNSGSGLVISETYIVASKNQLGPTIGMSCIIALWLLFNTNANSRGRKYAVRASCLAAFAVLFTDLLIFRNRSGIVGVVVVSIVFLVHELRRRRAIQWIMWIFVSAGAAIMLLLTGWLNVGWQFLWDSLTLHFDFTNGNDLSAGRTDVYAQALTFAWAHPLFGELGAGAPFGQTAHNYILNKWVAFGFLGSLPFVLFYVSLWKHATLTWLAKREVPLSKYLLMFVLFISLFEYTYPFGPGMATVMAWFLLGQEKDRVSDRRAAASVGHEMTHVLRRPRTQNSRPGRDSNELQYKEPVPYG